MDLSAPQYVYSEDCKKVKVKVTLEESRKTQTLNTDIALLFL